MNTPIGINLLDEATQRLNTLDRASNYDLFLKVIGLIERGDYNTEVRDTVVSILESIGADKGAKAIADLPDRTFCGPPCDWQLSALQLFLNREVERIKTLRQKLKEAERRIGHASSN